MKALLACLFCCCRWFQEDPKNEDTCREVAQEMRSQQLPFVAERMPSPRPSDEIDINDVDFSTFRSFSFSDDLDNIQDPDITAARRILNNRPQITFETKMELVGYLRSRSIQLEVQRQIWNKMARDCSVLESSRRAVLVLLATQNNLVPKNTFTVSHCRDHGLH